MSTTTKALEALDRLGKIADDHVIYPEDVDGVAADIATIRAALEECERLQAKLERVGGLAKEWAGSPYARDIGRADELREALSGPEARAALDSTEEYDG